MNSDFTSEIDVSNLPNIKYEPAAETLLKANDKHSSLYKNTQGVEPEKVAEVNKISKQLKTDPVYVNDNLDNARHAAEQPEWEDLRRRNPKLYKSLSDPAFMSLARKDVDVLSKMEATPKPSLLDVGIIAKSMGQSFMHVGAYRGITNRAYFDKFDVENEADRKALMRDVRPDEAMEMKKLEAKYLDMGLSNVGDPKRIEKAAMQEWLSTGSQAWDKVAKSEMFQFSEDVIERQQNSSGYIENVLTTVAGSAPDMLMQFANPVLGVASMMSTMFGAKYESELYLQKQKGLSDIEAKKAAYAAAKISATGQTPMEFAGNVLMFKMTGKMIKPGSTTEFFLSAIKSALGEGGEEWLQQFPDELGSIVANNKDKSPEEIFSLFAAELETIAFSPEAWESFSLGFGAGLLIPMGGKAASMPFQQMKKRQQAKDQKKYLDALAELAGLTQMQEIAPEEFAQYVNDIAGENPNVYLQADILQDITADADVDIMEVAEKFGVTQEDMEYALDTGTDIEINVGTLIANMPGDENIQYVRGHLKSEPDGIDLENEVQEQEQEQEVVARTDKEFKRQQKRLLAKEQRDYLQKKLKAQTESLAVQLAETGMNTENAEAHIQILETRATAWAAATGKHASEWFERAGIRFTTESPTSNETILDQTDTVTMENLDPQMEVEVMALSPDGSVVKAMVSAKMAMEQTDTSVSKLRNMLEECL